MVYLCFFFAVVAFWQLGLRYHRSQRLDELSERSIVELGELKRQLTNRHVIVSHLADSLPSSFDPNFERQKLREISQTAEASLSTIDPRKPCASQIRDFMSRERELANFTRDLIDSIETDERFNQAHLVTSCIEGLDKANTQIGDRTSLYNSSAIAHQNLRRTSFLQQRKRHAEFTVFEMEDWNAGNASRS